MDKRRKIWQYSNVKCAEENEMKCSNCGKKVKKEGTYCPSCGKEIMREPKVKQKLSKKAKIIISVVCSIAILISGTIGGLYFYFSRNNIPTDPDSIYVSFSEGFTDVTVTDENSALEAIASVADVIGIKNAKKELKISSTNTVDGDTYYRFGQYYEGISVYGRDVVIAADDDGTALALTGNFAKIENIKKYDLDEIDKDSAVVYGLDPAKICTVSYEDIDGEEYHVFTDVKSKEVVDRLCMTYTASEKTYPYREKDGTYSLYDSKRNIRILNSNGKELKYTGLLMNEDGKYQRIFYTGKNKDNHQNAFSGHWGKYEVEYIVNDNISVVKSNTADGFDSSATKLMDNMALTYDFYLEKLGRSGFDGSNGLIFASYNDNYDNGNNAYASGGSLLSFGKHSTLSVDLIAHEYTHSVEKTISNMNYEGESGAIMEGYSDIFGEIVEDYSDGQMDNDCDWVNPYRNIKGPLETKNPKVYEGENWKTTEDKLDKKGNSINDHGHVHNNSTVISHAAYLMNIGIDGDESKKISTETLADLWYRTLFILKSDATFTQLRNAVELSARIMKENGELTEEQYSTVSQACESVGIPNNVYTYFKTVKNQFDLRVLNPEGKKDLDATVKIYKNNTTVFTLILNTESKEKKLVKEAVFNSLTPDKGTHFKLNDGTYFVEIYDNLSKDKKPLRMKLVVDGDNESATDNITLYTDFKSLFTVVLNKNKDDKKETSIFGYGNVVNCKNCLYYWEYNSDSFLKEDANFAYYDNNKNAQNRLICRTADGKEKVVLIDNGFSNIAIVNDVIYYQSAKGRSGFSIKACSIDGSIIKDFGEGKLCGITDNGKYVIVQGTDLYSIDTGTNSLNTIADGNFLVCDNNSVIFTRNNQAEEIDKKEINIYKINGSGKDEKKLYVNQAMDLESVKSISEEGYFFDGYLTVSLPYIKDGKLYFIFEHIAGTGQVTQSSRILCIDMETGASTELKSNYIIDSGEPQSITINDTDYQKYVNDYYYQKPLNKREYADFSTLEIGEFGTEGSGALKLEFCETIGEKQYILLTYGNFAAWNGWRQTYQFKKCALYEKDLTLGKVVKIYDTDNGENLTSPVSKNIPENSLNWGNHHYAIYDDCAETWQEAQEYCKSLGGHLATISSQEENDALFAYMQSQNYESAYFGLSDHVEEGIWCWVNEENGEYTNWHLNEPNSENSNEDYAMFYYKYSDGTWNDGDFNGSTVNGGKTFICEWD